MCSSEIMLKMHVFDTLMQSSSDWFCRVAYAYLHECNREWLEWMLEISLGLCGHFKLKNTTLSCPVGLTYSLLIFCKDNVRTLTYISSTVDDSFKNVLNKWGLVYAHCSLQRALGNFIIICGALRKRVDPSLWNPWKRPVSHKLMH